MGIRWHLEDEVWYGWLPDQDMREDEPQLIVKQPEPGVWAGWLNAGGLSQCITLDHSTASGAKSEVQQAFTEGLSA